MAHDYDVIFIGAGTGGYVGAIRAAQLGLKVAVVEKQKALGGTCLLWGCIPTKALLEHAHALKVVQNVKDWGVTIGQAGQAGTAGLSVGIDMAQVQTRKDRIVTGLSKGVEFLFKKNKIELDQGHRAAGRHGGVDVIEGEQRRRCAPPARSSSPPARSPAACRASTVDRKRIITSDEAIGLPRGAEGARGDGRAAPSAWSSRRSSGGSAAR